MPIVDENRLKGNFAESTVASWISQMCLVRPVASGTDIGIDLYCESVLHSIPHSHFWVQVKAIPSSKLGFSNSESIAWYDFETKDLHYWARQPIPVYAFLVPVLVWPPEIPDKIFGIRITEFVVKNQIPDQSQIRLKSTGSFDRETINVDLKQFLTQIVPWDASANYVQRGIIAPIDTPIQEEYSRFPSEIGFRHLEKIKSNIRDAAVMGLIDSLQYERLDPSKTELRRSFQDVVDVFEDDLHDLGISMRVRAFHEDNKISEAISYIENAFNRIRNEHSKNEYAKKFRLHRLRRLLEDFREF